LNTNPPQEKHCQKKKNLAILFGGRSAEHEVSLLSAKSIFNNLDKNKFEITSIYINKQGMWRIVESPLLPLQSLNEGEFFFFLPWRNNNLAQEIEADVYFPILHGPYGEDGTIQGLFEMADVPYVGATVLASSLGMDKAMAKIIFKERNLPVVNHLILYEFEWRKERSLILEKIKKELPLPLFIKPCNLGSSIGISKAKSYSEIVPAIENAFLYDRKILVEEGIKGRELECSVLGNDEPLASLPGELIPSREFYDYRDKYIDNKTSFRIPAELPEAICREIQRISKEAFRAIDCSGMARVDFFWEEKSERLILSEVNTIPGFTEISMYPKLWEVSGLSYPLLLERLIELALERHKKKKRDGIYFTP